MVSGPNKGLVSDLLHDLDRASVGKMGETSIIETIDPVNQTISGK
jgi:hypothetical protein